jgi:hypothetical protein
MDLALGRDSLDVSLHDSDLQEEVELTTLLMVAANEADGPIAQRVVDEILGTTGRRTLPMIGHQRSGSSSRLRLAGTPSLAAVPAQD